MKAYIATALLLSMPLGIMGGIGACDLQQKCLAATIKKVSENLCDSAGDCEYEICLTLDFDATVDCRLSGTQTVSHTCVRPDDGCLDGTGCFFRGTSTETGAIGDGFVQCQTVPPGGGAKFLIKDQSDCTPGDLVLDVISPDNTVTVTELPDATCEPSPPLVDGDSCGGGKNVDSCTGNAQGKECVWTVLAPTCCGANEANCCPAPVEGCETTCEGFDCCEAIGGATQGNCCPTANGYCVEECIGFDCVPTPDCQADEETCCPEPSDACVDTCADFNCCDEIGGPTQGNCCPTAHEYCEGECAAAGIECPEWKCKMVCEQVITDPYTCTEDQPSRRTLKKVKPSWNQVTRSWLRA